MYVFDGTLATWKRLSSATYGAELWLPMFEQAAFKYRHSNIGSCSLNANFWTLPFYHFQTSTRSNIAPIPILYYVDVWTCPCLNIPMFVQTLAANLQTGVTNEFVRLYAPEQFDSTFESYPAVVANWSLRHRYKFKEQTVLYRPRFNFHMR